MPQEPDHATKEAILVVEDRHVSRRILKDFLKNQGFEVHVAENGQECMRQVLNTKPNLILLDLKIPIIDGWEVARWIKSNKSTQHIPIIATTAQALSGDREQALEAGCNDYLTKPLNHELLLERIHHWLHPEN